jgi:TonB family protein
MTALILSLFSLSVKIALLGGVVWMQLYLLRRAPAASRSRMCAVALAAILLLITGEVVAPAWLVKAPLITISTTAAAVGPATTARTSFASIAVIAIGLLWLAGVAVMLVRAIVGRRTLAITRRQSTAAESISGVDVRIADVQTPILSGLRRPAILLPLAASDWTDDQRRMVVTHELTHFRQGDVWTNFLAQMLRAVFWFHPAVWMLIARLSREQELTCDEAVVASGHSPHDYAAFLLAAVRGLKSHDLLACSMAGSGAKSLKQRFASLLDPTPRRPMGRRVVALLAVVGLAAVSLSVVRPVWAQTKEKIYKVGPGVTPPKVLTKVEPKYTPEARDAKIAGSVLLKVVVTAEGKADEIEVVRGLDSGLDQKAIEALSQWTFQPATKDGVAVAVYATIEVNFRLL